MDASAVIAFWLVALLLIIAPGADWAFTLSAALRGNAVRSAVGGMITGYAAMTLVVAAGVGGLVAESPAALTVITVIGGVYLVWLGVASLRHPSGLRGSDSTSDTANTASTAAPAGPRSSSRSDSPTDSPTNFSTYAEGIGVSALNPKGLLIFVALLPQFTNSRAPWPLAVQMSVLGLAFTLTCAVFYSTLGTFARTVLAARPGAARAMSRLTGIGMVFIGTGLVLQRVLG